MRVGTGVSNKITTGPADPLRKAAHPGPRLTQRPQRPRLAGSGDITGDGNRLHVPRLAQKNLPPLQCSPLTTLDSEAMFDSPQSLHNYLSSLLNQEAPAGRTPYPADHGTTGAYWTPPSPSESGKPREVPSPVPAQKSRMSRLMETIAPPVRNKLYKAPPPQTGPERDTTASRLKRKLAPAQAPEAGTSVAGLLDKIAPPVRNKLYKPMPPKIGPDGEGTLSRLRDSVRSKASSVSHRHVRPEGATAPGLSPVSAREAGDTWDSTTLAPTPTATASLSSFDDKSSVTTFFSRCSAEMKALLR